MFICVPVCPVPAAVRKGAAQVHWRQGPEELPSCNPRMPHPCLFGVFNSAKQGRQEARKAAGHQVCLAREAKLPGKEAPKTTGKTCHPRRVTSPTTDDNG